MAIKTVKTVDYRNNNTTDTTTIGLSDLLTNLDFNDVISNVYAATDIPYLYNFKTAKTDTVYMNDDDLNGYPLKFENYRQASPYYRAYDVYSSDYEPSDNKGYFSGIIFLYSEISDSQTYTNRYPSHITKTNSANMRVVTQMDVHQIKTRYMYEEGTTDNRLYCEMFYSVSENGTFYRVDAQPYIIIKEGTDTLIVRLSFLTALYISATVPYRENNDGNSDNKITAPSGLKTIDDNLGGFCLATTWTDISHIVWIERDDVRERSILKGTSDLYNLYTYIDDGNIAPLTASVELNTTDRDASIIDYLYRIGLNFVTKGKEYKPIIEDGYIIGYSDDLNAKSDIDNYTYADGTAHTVPTERPTKDDVIDPMDSNDVYSLSGVVKYYLMNSATLAGMMNDIESITDDPNVMNGFVSCYQIPLQSDNMVVTGEGSNIRINGHTLNTTANRVAAGKTITLTTFGVPRRHNNAYDYMSKYFVYTPYTDVIPLNYKCAGNTIQIQLHPCPENCTASITVKCNNMIIYKSTVAIGTTSAISVENNAEKQLSIVDSCAKYAGSALSTGVGVATGNIPAVAAGAIGLIASTTHAMTSFTQSYNHSYGINAGNMLSLMPSGIYLIEYVVKPDKPDNFARINGNLVNKSAVITTGMGFTKFDKPRISTTLTAPENAELTAMLENGVIL